MTGYGYLVRCPHFVRSGLSHVNVPHVSKPGPGMCVAPSLWRGKLCDMDCAGRGLNE